MKISYLQQRENKVASLSPEQIANAFAFEWLKEHGSSAAEATTFVAHQKGEHLAWWTSVAGKAVANKLNPIQELVKYECEGGDNLKNMSPEFRQFASAYNVFTL